MHTKPVGLLLLMGLWPSCTTATQSYKVSSTYNIAWSFTDTMIQVDLKLAGNTSWVGFGIGEEGAGAMPGADIVGCWTDEDATEGWSCEDR